MDRLTRKTTFFLLAVATSVGFALRLRGSGQSLAGDEMLAYIATAGASVTGVIDQITSGIEATPPLFFLLARATETFGDPALTIRIPSLVAGTLLVPAVYLLGVRLAPSKAALVASAVVAVNPYAIWFSDEARPYALLSLLSCASTLALLRAIEARSAMRWAIYAIGCAAVMYTHYSGVFVLAAQSLWAAVTHRDQIRSLAVSVAGAVVLFLPWTALLQFSDQTRSLAGTFLGFGVALENIVRVLGGTPVVELNQVPGYGPLALLVAACVISVFMAQLDRKGFSGALLPPEKGEVTRRQSMALISVLAALTPVGMIVVSLATASDFAAPRYLSAAFPAMMIMLGVVLTLAQASKWILPTSLAFVAGLWGCANAANRNYERSDIRAAAQWIDRTAQGRVIIVEKLEGVNGPSPMAPYFSDSPGGSGRGRSRLSAWRYLPVPLNSELDAWVTAFGSRLEIATVINGCEGFGPAGEPPQVFRRHLDLIATSRFPGVGCGTLVRLYRPSRSK